MRKRSNEARLIQKFVDDVAKEFELLGTRVLSSREIEYTFKVDELKITKIIVRYENLVSIEVTGFREIGMERGVTNIHDPHSKTIIAAMIRRIIKNVHDDEIEVVYRISGPSVRGKKYKEIGNG